MHGRTQRLAQRFATAAEILQQAEKKWQMRSISHGMGDKSFPGFEHVYYLRSPGGSVFMATGDMSTQEAFGLTRGEMTPTEPVELRWFVGRRVPGDFVWTGMAVLGVVSDKVVSVLRKSFCSGWSTYPVRLYDDADNLMTGFHGFAVHGRCGPMQLERSVHVEADKGAGRDAYRGLFFDESGWDGSDIFVPSDRSGMVFVLERVRSVLLQVKITGARFERVDQYDTTLLR